MLGSKILEVAIGMAFVYLLLSVLCSALKEGIAAGVGLRATNLVMGIQSLLQDPNLAKQLFAHPLIKRLSQPADPAAKPAVPAVAPSKVTTSYIPARTFAIALIHILAEKGASIAPQPSAGQTQTMQAQTLQTQAEQLLNIQKAINDNTLLSADAKRSLSALMTAADNNLEQFQEHLEKWFNDSMDRVSGWYKRQAQKIIVCLAVLTCIVLNVDSVRMVDCLYRDNGLRALAVAAAQQCTNQVMFSSTGMTPTSLSNALDTAIEVQKQLGQTKLPIGWPDEWLSAKLDQAQGFSAVWLVLAKIIGLCATMIAVSLGAPFWFDLLGKLVNLRLTGDPPDK